jgi:hypothetical protein
MTTPPIKTDNEKEKEQLVIKKFIEHRDFNVSWATNNAEEWMTHSRFPLAGNKHFSESFSRKFK